MIDRNRTSGRSLAGSIPSKPMPPPPVVAYEDVTASCGHVEKFGLFEDKRDKFRDQRRQKVAERPCTACREKKRAEEVKAQAANRSEKRQPSPRDMARLPDGAKFDVVYDATRTEWTGTLTVGGQVFTGVASGVLKLLRQLDRKYQESLIARQ
jgi:hypothetical protein